MLIPSPTGKAPCTPVFTPSRNIQNSDSELLNIHTASGHALTWRSGREMHQLGKECDGGKRGAEDAQEGIWGRLRGQLPRVGDV